jgi:hypothetical protein
LVEEFEFGYTGQLKTYVYDYDQMILSHKESTKEQDHYINEYYLGERYAARKEGLMEGATGFSPKGQKMILAALDDKFWHIRVLALGKVGTLDGEYAVKGLEIVKGMVANDPKSDVRSAALIALGQLTKDEPSLIAMYKDRISTDQSYSVITEALGALGGINSEEAMKIASSLEKENSSKVITGITKLYSAHGGSDKFEFIKDAMEGTTVRGFDKFQVLSSLTTFILRFDPEISDRAFDVYAHQSEVGGFYIKMFMPQYLDHLVDAFDTKIVGLEAELADYEKNNDAVYADQTRKKIKDFRAVQVKYSTLSEELAKKKEASQH